MQRGSASLLVVLLGASGCSSGGGGSGPSTASEFMGALIDTLAPKVAHCNAVTIAMAEEDLRTMLGPQLAGAAEAAGRVGFDRENARRCLELLRNSTCAELDVATGEELDATCESAFVPKVEEGGDCTLFANTNVTGECISGVCKVPSAEACFDHGTCSTRAGDGQECKTLPDDRECARGFECNLDHVCVARLAVTFQDQVGAPCHRTGEGVLLGDRCNDGLFCDPDGWSCQEQLPPGQECDHDAMCLQGACPAGECVAWRRIGDDCTPGAEQCERGAFCQDGTCVAWPGVGGTCGTPTGEDPRFCVAAWCPVSGAHTGACQPFLDDGDTCDPAVEDPLQCGFGAVCDVTTCAATVCTAPDPS